MELYKCPLAFMRGRTLDSILVILDEINATTSQMKMFLTRMGFQKFIITGDESQIDLPLKKNLDYRK